MVPLGMVYVGHLGEDKVPRTRYDGKRIDWQATILAAGTARG